jgi:hypothetical protein
MKMARVGEQAFRIARCSGVLYGFCGYSENGLASVEASAAQMDRELERPFSIIGSLSRFRKTSRLNYRKIQDRFADKLTSVGLTLNPSKTLDVCKLTTHPRTAN